MNAYFLLAVVGLSSLPATAEVLHRPSFTSVNAVLYAQCGTGHFPGDDDRYIQASFRVFAALGDLGGQAKCSNKIDGEPAGRLPPIGSLILLEDDVQAWSGYPKKDAVRTGTLKKGTKIRILRYAGIYPPTWTATIKGVGEMYALVEAETN